MWLSRVATGPNSPTLRYLPKKNENRCPHKHSYLKHLSIIPNNREVEATQMSNNWWIDVVSPYSGLLFNDKKEWSIDTCYNMMDLESIQFSSVQSLSRVRLCNPTDCSTPGFPVHQQLLELTQTHVHRVMTPFKHLILCRPLLLLPSIFPSLHQGLFQWVSSSHEVAKVLELQLQHQSFQWIFRTDFL